ncbi:2-oxoglutarate and iron-dependent oxygenase domain-containing protein 2-like [Symsagittifera roscoffensis]|uniref:2-oxoglutarate and iron-dependent oxygenase domain-containing protein 2-like n=1 Tax=Symsagittifera roscoffensis TaxID=84072 RepID=UPI00307BAFF5
MVEGDKNKIKSAIERAIEVGERELSAKKPNFNKFYEEPEFWIKYADLLDQAWAEFPHLHPALFTYNEVFKEKFVEPELRAAVEMLQKSAKTGDEQIDETPVWNLLTESKDVKGVYKLNNGLFTEEFRRLLLEELEHVERSGIPLKRPSSMNRCGCNLAQIGMQPVFDQFCREFVSPIIEMLYPEYIALGDTCDNYPFTVDYRKDPSKDFDVDMKHHRDSSLATLNVCLGYKFTAGNLQFWGDDPDSLPYDDSKGEGEMKMTPGLSLLHKGGHMHAALPITSGHRVNLIMWMYGEGGYVRSGKCPPTLQTTALGRWSER